MRSVVSPIHPLVGTVFLMWGSQGLRMIFFGSRFFCSSYYLLTPPDFPLAFNQCLVPKSLMMLTFKTSKLSNPKHFKMFYRLKYRRYEWWPHIFLGATWGVIPLRKWFGLVWSVVHQRWDRARTYPQQKPWVQVGQLSQLTAAQGQTARGNMRKRGKGWKYIVKKW